MTQQKLTETINIESPLTSSLFRIVVLHGAPKDSHSSTETYLVANSEEQVANWIQSEKCYGYWMDDDGEEESRLRFADEDCEREISFREWVMLNRGDLTDEEGWEDAYYGVTKWGWERMEATSEEMAVLLKLGIAIEANSAESKHKETITNKETKDNQNESELNSVDDETVCLAYYSNGFIDDFPELLAVCASSDVADGVVERHKLDRDRDREYEDKASWWTEHRTVCTSCERNNAPENCTRQWKAMDGSGLIEPYSPLIDPYFAPDGFKAIAATDGCTGCWFGNENICGMDRVCSMSERPDSRSVIFIPSEHIKAERYKNEK